MTIIVFDRLRQYWDCYRIRLQRDREPVRELGFAMQSAIRPCAYASGLGDSGVRLGVRQRDERVT